MRKPLVLDGERTCYNCSHFRLCHVRHKMWDGIVIGCSGMLESNDSHNLFVALARACVSFDYRPDPPSDADEPQPVTLVIQVSGDDSQTVASNVGMALRGFNATLHTHDMKKVS